MQTKTSSYGYNYNSWKPYDGSGSSSVDFVMRERRSDPEKAKEARAMQHALRAVIASGEPGATAAEEEMRTKQAADLEEMIASAPREAGAFGKVNPEERREDERLFRQGSAKRWNMSLADQNLRTLLSDDDPRISKVRSVLDAEIT